MENNNIAATLFPLEAEEMLSLSDFCSALGISTATCRNWIKLGKIQETKRIGNKLFFSESYKNAVLSSLSSQKTKALKSRRNKRFISGNKIYKGYIPSDSPNVEIVSSIVDCVDKCNIELNDSTIAKIIANYAIKLFFALKGIKTASKNILSDFLNKQVNGLNECEVKLIHELLGENEPTQSSQDLKQVLDKEIYFLNGEDTLGLIYISLKNLGNRKSKGAYYTPTKVVDELVTDLISCTNLENKKILDPCCGTGNFIISLAKNKISIDNINACDIDETAVKIARINAHIFFNCNNYQLLSSSIYCCDFLNTAIDCADVVLGNPPWGAEYSAEEQRVLAKKYSSAKNKNVESFALFVEKSLNILKNDGVLSFVLPEAILNIGTHIAVREYICANAIPVSIHYLGNVFDGVQCPSIIISLKKVDGTNTTINNTHIYKNGNDHYVIKEERPYNFASFDYFMSDEVFLLIRKISNLKNVEFLANNSSFALGIVTGDNKAFLSKEHTMNTEPILRGSDIARYFPISCSNYVEFLPEKYQQVAPVECYRAKEKLLYKFISKYPVFCYDNKQTLSLNSCNILIPKIPNMAIKYIMAILNSRIIGFFYSQKFNSVKVLRSYVEKIPIPRADNETQEKICALVDELIANKQEEIFDEIDREIALLYDLTDSEYDFVLQNTNSEITLLT